MRAILCWLVGIVVASACLADVVELKSGDRLDGTFKQATSAGVVIDVGGQSITMPLEKVRAIYFGAGPKPTTEISLRDESLGALNGLKSVTNSGINLRDYPPRVLDAKVKVDQYLRSPVAGDEKVRAAISLAMRYYELASAVWPLNIAQVGTWTPQMFQMEREIGRVLREEKEFSSCALIAKILSEADEANAQAKVAAEAELQKKPKSRNSLLINTANTDHLAISIKLRPPGLWACASEKLAEAAQELGGDKK